MLKAQLRRVAAWLYRWRWPVGWWRLRRRATLDIAGQRLQFPLIAGSPGEWWAQQARRGRWEAPVVRELAEAIRPGDTVFDIGAWIGPYTLLASRLAGATGRVFAFEPDPIARAQLLRNLEANGATNVIVVSHALAAQAGTARLTGGGSEARVGAEGEVEVQTRTLPDFVAEHGAPDVVKVDIEGGEIGLDRAVLASARAVFVEIHVPVFRSQGVDPDAYLEAVAAGRPIVRLEGGAENFNVRIG